MLLGSRLSQGQGQSALDCRLHRGMPAQQSGWQQSGWQGQAAHHSSAGLTGECLSCCCNVLPGASSRQCMAAVAEARPMNTWDGCPCGSGTATGAARAGCGAPGASLLAAGDAGVGVVAPLSSLACRGSLLQSNLAHSGNRLNGCICRPAACRAGLAHEESSTELAAEHNCSSWAEGAGADHCERARAVRIAHAQSCCPFVMNDGRAANMTLARQHHLTLVGPDTPACRLTDPGTT